MKLFCCVISLLNSMWGFKAEYIDLRCLNRTCLFVYDIGVANLLVEAGVTDVDVLQAALLHDTVEDTDTTHEELTQHFGERVAGIVAEVNIIKSLLLYNLTLFYAIMPRSLLWINVILLMVFVY